MFTNRQGNTDTSEIQHLIDGKALSEEQTRFIDTVRKLSDVFGLDFEFYASEVDENGQRHGDAGYIDDSGKIHIDIFAGQEKSAFIARDSTLTSTLLHELTHFIHDWSPKAWKEMYNYVVARYSPYGSVQAALEAIRAREKLEGREEITDDLAQDEFMAQCCEALFEDEAGIRDFAAKYKNTAQKIVEWLENVLEKISGINIGHSESDIAAVISQWQDGIEELREKWLAALEDAANNKNASDRVLKENANAQAEVRKARGIRDEKAVAKATGLEGPRTGYSVRNKTVNDTVDKAIKQKGNIDEKYNQKRISEFPDDITALVSKASDGRIDLSQKYVAINGSDVWHEYQRRTNISDEISRRQVAFTDDTMKEAIMAIYSPEIVESVFSTGRNPTQRQSFAYAKKSADGHYIVVEAVGGKRSQNVVPVMILQFNEEKWNEMISQGKTLGEVLYENDTQKREALDVDFNKKNRVTVAQFASKEAIANTPRSPRFNNTITQSEVSVKPETEKNPSTESNNKRSSRSKRDMSEDLSSDIKNNLIRRLINQNAKQGEEEPSTAAHLKDQMIEKKERLDKMEPVAVVNISDDIYSEERNDVLNAITDAFEKYGFVIQRQGFGDVIVDRKRLSKALSSYVKTANDRAAFTAVPNVIKDGLFIAYHEDHKSRHYGTITLAAPVIINGNRGNIGVVVKLTDKNYYKLHRIFTPDGKNFIIDNVKGDIAEAADGVDKQLRYTPTDNISYEDNTTNQSKSQESSEENPTTEIDNKRRSRSKRDEKSGAAAEAEAKAGEIAKKWGLSGKKTEALGRGLANIFESVSGAEVDMEFVRQQAASLAAKTANGMISPDMPADISDKLSFLRSFGAVSLTEEQRNAAAKLSGTFKEYRSRISSAVKINEKGEDLSTAWDKLSKQMPELFPADTAESDMARVMLQNLSRLLADERAYRMEGDELTEARESLQREIYDAANQYIQYNRVTSGLTETKLKNVVPRPSVRTVLAEAALKTAKTDEERAALREYKLNLETVNDMQADRNREYSKLLSMLPKSGGILKSPKSTTENYFLILPFHPINFCRVYFKFR